MFNSTHFFMINSIPQHLTEGKMRWELFWGHSLVGRIVSKKKRLWAFIVPPNRGDYNPPWFCNYMTNYIQAPRSGLYHHSAEITTHKRTTLKIFKFETLGGEREMSRVWTKKRVVTNSVGNLLPKFPRNPLSNKKPHDSMPGHNP